MLGISMFEGKEVVLDITLCRWIKPPKGHIKVNVDGSWLQELLVGKCILSLSFCFTTSMFSCLYIYRDIEPMAIQSRALSKHPLLTTLVNSTKHIEPTCFTQVSKDPTWWTCMTLEFDALVHNETWTLVPWNPSIMWLDANGFFFFCQKHCADGTIEIYKACLLLKVIIK